MDIAKASLKMFDDIGRTMLGAPIRDGKDIKGVEDRKLTKHLRNITFILNTDAASDELLASHQMTAKNGDLPPLLPNVQAIIRDRAHAGRRVLQKPANADPYLKGIVEQVLTSKHSIVQRIENSHLHRDTLQERCAAEDARVSTRIKNLRAAKHRFESWAKPMGRLTIYRNAIIAVAEVITQTRASTVEAKDADAFKSMIDVELFISMAMLADAADEGLLLVRQNDSESMDVAIAPGHPHEKQTTSVELFHINFKTFLAI